MQVGEVYSNWADAMKLVSESIQVENNPSDSLHDLFDPLSDRTKKWVVTRGSQDSIDVREAVERLF